MRAEHGRRILEGRDSSGTRLNHLDRFGRRWHCWREPQLAAIAPQIRRNRGILSLGILRAAILAKLYLAIFDLSSHASFYSRSFSFAHSQKQELCHVMP